MNDEQIDMATKYMVKMQRSLQKNGMPEPHILTIMGHFMAFCFFAPINDHKMIFENIMRKLEEGTK